MKKYLHKAKSFDGFWYYGNVVYNFCFERFGDLIPCAICKNNDWIQAIPETVCQWVVTEDGQDIFENDKIEEWKHDRLLRSFVVEDIRTLTREYDKSEHDSVWKVVGNKHEDK